MMSSQQSQSQSQSQSQTQTQTQTQTQRDWVVGASQPVPWGEDTQWKQFDPSDETAAFSRYSLLISCVVPRPIALCSTVSPDRSQNCAPFSYFGAISHDPLLISVTICNNGRGKSRTKKDTLVNIESSRDFVVNIMSEWYLDSANHTCGNFAPEIDEIAISGLHTMQSVKVKPARIREAAVQMECQVYSLNEIFNDANEHTATNIIGRVVNIHVNESVLDENESTVNVQKLRPVGRAGGNIYTTVGECIDIPRPKV